MTPAAPADDREMLVSRLRAAGCVFAEDEAEILLGGAREPDEVERLAARRIAGEPLEYLVGWAEFFGLRIIVEPGVFVPRRRTELLVTQALQLAPARPVIVELCCGAGAVAAALAAGLDAAEIHAVDVDPAAVRCARRNVPAATVHLGDLDAPLPRRLRGRVDLLVANAPYVPTDEIRFMPVEARDHERHAALDGGPDGLDVQRRVIAVAPRWLAPGGHLLIETSTRQAAHTAAAMTAVGLRARVVADDEVAGTVAVATMPD